MTLGTEGRSGVRQHAGTRVDVDDEGRLVAGVVREGIDIGDVHGAAGCRGRGVEVVGRQGVARDGPTVRIMVALASDAAHARMRL